MCLVMGLRALTMAPYGGLSGILAGDLLSQPIIQVEPYGSFRHVSGLLLRNLNSIAIVQKPCYLLYIHIILDPPMYLY